MYHGRLLKLLHTSDVNVMFTHPSMRDRRQSCVKGRVHGGGCGHVPGGGCGYFHAGVRWRVNGKVNSCQWRVREHVARQCRVAREKYSQYSKSWKLPSVLTESYLLLIAGKCEGEGFRGNYIYGEQTEEVRVKESIYNVGLQIRDAAILRYFRSKCWD